MKRLNTGCVVAVVFLALATAALQSEEVATFGHFDSFLAIALAPDGAIWFSPGCPTRLMRVEGDTVQQIQVFGESRFAFDTPCDVAFAPNGQMWLEQQAISSVPPRSRFYSFDQYQGLSEIEINAEFWQEVSTGGMFFDPESHLYGTYYRLYSRGQRCASELTPGVNFYHVWRLSRDESAIIWGAMEVSQALVSGDKTAWIGGYSLNIYTGEAYRRGLFLIDLETGEDLANYVSEDGISDENTSPRFLDASGWLWVMSQDQVMTFDGARFEVFGPFAGDERYSDLLVMDASGAIWASGEQTVSRFRDGDTTTFGTQEGLPGGAILDYLIDFDGNLWLHHQGGELSRISTGGWPPMRLSLNKVETTDSVAVVANVFNTQPVVGVDVYIAIQMNGQMLCWPDWQPIACPLQLNLYAGFNESATIIEARREAIPPGCYTFWGCMTGRNTSKLIGPIDRKFETLTIEVD